MATEEQTDVSRLWSSITAYSWGQRLTISNRVVSKLSFSLERTGSPGGTVTFYIRSLDDTILASKLWGNSNDITTTQAWYEVTLDTPILVDEEVYLLVRSSTGSSGNVITVYDANNADVKAGEYLVGRSNGGTYNLTNTGLDFGYKYTYELVAPPTVTTQAVTDISGTTATGNGNITVLGVPDPTAHGVCWKTFAAYESDGILPLTTDSSTDEGAASATGAFTSTMSGLTADTKYILRAYATNSQGTGYGNAVEFTADKGTVFPIDPLLRVSGLRRTFWSGIGGESVYQSTLSLGGISTTYVSAISERKSPNAIAPTPLPSGAGYQQSDYEAWLRKMDIDTILMIFGHFPTYTEWVNWIRFGKAKK